jgi:hypothetical protein
MKVKARKNRTNPYVSGFVDSVYIPVWDAIECAYCGAKVGEYCIVQYTRGTTRRMAHEIHSVRHDTQRAAYDAWEKGREQGQTDIVNAVQKTLDLHQQVTTMLREVS